jgi:hypothetical protein
MKPAATFPEVSSGWRAVDLALTFLTIASAFSRKPSSAAAFTPQDFVIHDEVQPLRFVHRVLEDLAPKILGHDRILSD